MKQFVRVTVLCATVAVFALANLGVAGAGFRIQGLVLVNPNPVELGGTVTISNGTDEESLCETNEFVEPVVHLSVYSLEDDLLGENLSVTPAADGTWSVEFTVPDDDAALGTWEVDAMCDHANVDAVPLDLPAFNYNLAEFEVVPAEVPTPPDDGAAPAEEVRAAPRFTG